jgi:DNA-binding HxlR family transcriptional regulator
MKDNASRIPARSRGRRARGDVYNAACPSREVLNHVTSRWGSLVLIVLRERTHRFSELARRIDGVSEKMLAQSLKALEADGFVIRTVYPTIPPMVEYSLTKLGTEVAGHVYALTNWVEANVSHVLSCREGANKAPGA